MLRPLTLLLVLPLAGCMASQNLPAYQPAFGQGQYVYPQYLQPVAPPPIQSADLCNAQLYQNLVGRPEGTIHFAGLPQRTRVIKPAFTEDFDNDDPSFLDPRTPSVEVREYLPGQPVYLPNIRTIDDVTRLGPDQQDRLTIELDDDYTVSSVSCR